eukprot:GFKZ01015114.1.p2 GENE.GFKZ01015114.1~~GFKZ01015114.1.p2  ORF type:complete len:147 (-),score=9.10 GFKZ01015114.1:45-485(-)
MWRGRREIKTRRGKRATAYWRAFKAINRCAAETIQTHHQDVHTQKEELCHRRPKFISISKLWTVVSVCVIRPIWLERSRRIFDHSTRGNSWAARANKAGLDIKAHVESAIRRCPPAQGAAIEQMVKLFTGNKSEHRRILTAMLRYR